MSVAAHRLRRLDQVDASGGGFVPTDITGCIGWYDASHAASFTYHSGTLVSQWNDRSGAGNHLTSAASSTAPSRTGTQNGLTVVTFTPASFNVLDVSSALDSHVASCTNDFSFAAVYDTGTTSAAFLFGSMANFNNRGVGVFRQAAATIEFRARNAGAERARRVATPSDGWRTMTATVDVSASTGRIPYLRCNGVNGDAEIASSGANAAGSFVIGAREKFSSAYFDGQLAELIFYDNIISGSDMTDLETYLQDKWATW